MKIALYGMPCAGKSTLMDRITDAKVTNGSQELRRICGGSFLELSEEEKHQVRIKYTVVIVDSVINTGKSIMRIIDELKNHNPGIDVIIAANVIQNEAVELFKDYLVFATRLSKNSFVGVNQSKQTGKTGPDTADRLFNLIKKRY